MDDLDDLDLDADLDISIDALTKRSKRGRPGLPGGSRKLSVMVELSTFGALEKLCAETGRRLGEVVRDALRRGLAQR